MTTIAAVPLPTTITAEIKAAFVALYAKLLNDWTALKATLDSVGWFKISPSTIAAAWQFIENSILQFTGLVDSAGIPNPDKKAAVLAFVKNLYENVMIPQLPGPLKALLSIVGGETIIMHFLSGAIESAVALWHKVPVPVPPIPIPSVDPPKVMGGEATVPFPHYDK
jgi:hypothetical protein